MTTHDSPTTPSPLAVPSPASDPMEATPWWPPDATRARREGSDGSGRGQEGAKEARTAVPGTHGHPRASAGHTGLLGAYRRLEAVEAELAARDAAIVALADDLGQSVATLQAEGMPAWAQCTLMDSAAVRALIPPDDAPATGAAQGDRGERA